MQPKKILFASIPYDGHFNPLTGLAVYLKSKGHDVRWYTGSVYENKLRKLSIHHYKFKQALDLNQNNLDEVFPERVKIKNQIKKLKFDMQTSFILRSPEFYHDIKEINKEWDFDLMIADIVFTGTPFIKDLLKKPVISIGVIPLTESSKDLPPAGLGMTTSDTFFGRRKQDVLRFVADQILFKFENNLANMLFKEYGVSPTSGNIFDTLVKKSSLVLQIGTPGFEYKRSDLGKNIKFIGALLPFTPIKKETYALREEYKKYKRVVLVTQGTIEKDPEKIIVPTLEAYKNTDVLVIATTGGSKTKELQERFPHPNLIIEDFIPFNDIMPSADVYLTNGGYGGVMLGIENNLPLVVAGIHEGKNEINARIGYFELGVNLNTEFPTPEQIKSGVDLVLSKSKYKNNVKKLNEEFKKYNAFRLCERYIGELLEDNQTKQKASKEQLVEFEV